ncbi:Mediator of RNA polymerase II transcription subunit 13 [Mycena kentingensis (nom. inval.)]|nr:Mediator of RNA polymerase II transcription subunit 13 [Mycena kentingensis (nom. inval.)]
MFDQTTFQYERSSSVSSSLWSIWLSVPSRWRAVVYRAALHFLAQPQPLSKASRLWGAYFKLCSSSDEALATEYVRTHTSIPVPKVLDLVRIPPAPHTDHMWLMLSAGVDGTPLFDRGHRLLAASDEQVQRVCDTLRDWTGQLRRLTSPFGQRVCGFSGGSFRSFRISQDLVGPFTSLRKLNMLDEMSGPPSELERNPRLATLVVAQECRSYRFHLVHGDLLLNNILADEHLRPTALIDWECAAWMPEYWERLASSRGGFLTMWKWRDMRETIFRAYDEELELDREIQLLHGE